MTTTSRCVGYKARMQHGIQNQRCPTLPLLLLLLPQHHRECPHEHHKHGDADSQLTRPHTCIKTQNTK